MVLMRDSGTNAEAWRVSYDQSSVAPYREALSQRAPVPPLTACW